LINALCDKKQLAKTSGQPGKTQLINYFSLDTGDDDMHHSSRHLVDLPGYGYAKVTRHEREKWENMIDEYISKRENIAHIFVLIDSRHAPQKLDIAFVEKLCLLKKSFSLVFTKTDKVSQKDVSTHSKMFLQSIKHCI
jgi:GTP-binding protein